MRLSNSIRLMMLIAGCYFTFACGSACADVRLRVIDSKKKILQVEYRTEVLVVAGQKKRFFTFPDDGFAFAKDTLRVLRVKMLDSGEDLRWSLVPAKNDPNLQMLQVSHSVESPQGLFGEKKFIVDIVVEGRTDDIVFSQDGTMWVTYRTAHDVSFVIPDGSCLVETSERVKVGSDKEGTVAVAKGGEIRNVEFGVK